MPAYLEVWGEEGRALVALEGDRVTVGRSSSNDVPLREDATASRRHAVLERLAAGWSIADVGSTNGTFVNGELLDRPRPLYAGDEIVIGETRLVYWSERPQ